MTPDGSGRPRERVPVLIAGGGPVGLVLAALLARRGVRSLVIESDAGYCTGSRAICIARRSLEILGWIGAEERVRDIGLPWVGGRSFFRGQEVLHFTMPNEAGERFPPMVNIQQYEIEEAAHRAFDDTLAAVRWNTHVDAVESCVDGVRVGVRDASGEVSTIEADWLVACDGGRSTVRNRLGLQLRGVEYDGRYVIVDIEQATERAVERLAWFDPPSNPGSTILMHRQPGDVWRIDYQLGDDEDPVAAIAPEHVLPRVQSHLTMIGETAPWKPLWISIYNAKCLTLDAYRHGRVLFAGDAAHLVPIFGVRGLNSGVDDAGNLAWKLAAVVDGSASAALLDSYSIERVHAARENIAYGAKSTEFMAPPHAGFRLMRDAALCLALESDAVRPLLNPRQTTPIAYPVSYPDASAGDDVDALVGRPAPDAPIEGSAIAHLSQLFGQRFVLLRFDALPSDVAFDRVDCFEIVETGRPDARTLVDRSGEARRRYGSHRGQVVLVRPDGYVAGRWAAFDDARIEATLATFFDLTEAAHAH